ncbi:MULTISPECIES: thiamine-binding protein [unclassified Helicobacter]|uniref:thiamine-binding protein n=1 Tax=unclassified Helicobacter TaxID=2593540 RepID=UPI000CF02883|nr:MULTISPECIES: thiamine-binding protein [unclassified Helicobacter]
MAVLMEMSIFSISGEISKRQEVVNVLKTLKQKGVKFELASMGTSVECKDMSEALEVLKIATDSIDAKRYYVIAKFDCYEGRQGMLETRSASVLKDLN